MMGAPGLIIAIGCGQIAASALILTLAHTVRIWMERRRRSERAAMTEIRTSLFAALISDTPVEAQTIIRWPPDLLLETLMQAVHRLEASQARRLMDLVCPQHVLDHARDGLRSARSMTRLRACYVLAWHPGGVPLLQRTLRVDPDAAVRLIVAKGLVMRGCPPPLGVLARALGLGALRPSDHGRVALADPTLFPDASLARLAAGERLPAWLRTMARSILDARQTGGSEAVIGRMAA